MYETMAPFYLKVDEDLELRQRLPEDANELFALTDANRKYLMQWLPWLDHCLSPADTMRNIEAALHDAVEGTGLAVSIFERGQIVGVTGFNSIDRSNRIGHVGYWLGEQHQGRGIMTRAVRALVEHGFRVLGLNRITIAAATDNRSSRAIAERLGFRLEGRAQQAECLYGRMVDHALYAQTRLDWDRQRLESLEPTRVRAMLALDIPSSIALWQETEGVGLTADETPSMLAAFLDRNADISSVAVDAVGRRVGALLGGHDGRRGFLYHLAVDPAYRGRGLGRELVARTTALLGNCGIARATIMVYANHAEGRAFWEHLGWSVREDLSAMQRQLKL